MTLTHIIACIALAVAIGAAFAAFGNRKQIVRLYGFMALLNKDKVLGMLDEFKSELSEFTDKLEEMSDDGK